MRKLSLFAILLLVSGPAVAAFPTVEFVKVFAPADAAETHEATYPTTANYDIQANDLLLYLCTCDGTGDSVPLTEAGLSSLYSANNGALGSSIYYKIAAGTEGEAGDLTYTVDPSSLEEVICFSVAISGWHGTTVPEIGTAATGTSTTPDPPSITPSWGAEDNLYIVFIGENLGTTVSAWPASYTDNQNETDIPGGGVLMGAIATRNLNGSPENPGTATLAQNQAWVAHTAVVRPAASSSIAALAAAYYQDN